MDGELLLVGEGWEAETESLAVRLLTRCLVGASAAALSRDASEAFKLKALSNITELLKADAETLVARQLEVRCAALCRAALLGRTRGFGTARQGMSTCSFGVPLI